MHRYTDVPFPAYTYVPGKRPHPVREPEGHSFDRPEPHVDQFRPAQWRSCEAFLFGIDLFNAGFYWESHEQWEAAWHAVGRVGVEADFLKALIKLSAAGVKQLEGVPEGVVRHLGRSRELLLIVSRQNQVYCGFVIEELVDSVERVRQDVTRLPELKLLPN